MNIKLKATVKIAGDWKQAGDIAELPDKEALRLIDMGAAQAIDAPPVADKPDNSELEAMKAELARLQEFERQQLAAAAKAAAEAEAQADREEADRKAVEEAAAKNKAKASVKDDASGQADGK